MATLAQHISPQAFSARVIMTQAIKKLQHWIEVSYQRQQLADLDQHQLDDIGLDRLTAIAEARKPFWKSSSQGQ